MNSCAILNIIMCSRNRNFPVPREAASVTNTTKTLATRKPCPASFALAMAGAMACMVLADEKNQDGRSRDEALSIRRFQLMQGRVAAAKAESEERGFPRTFAPEPIFKYNDPIRGWLAGAVWKLGDEGRPKALLASELRRSVNGKPSISYEF